MSDRICGHCGGELNGFGFAGGFELCHTGTDPAWAMPLDCYRLVTVYGHQADGTCCRIQWRGPENCEEVFFMLGWEHEGVDQDDHSTICGLGPDGNDTARWGDTIVRRGDYWAVLKESGSELWKAYQDSVEGAKVIPLRPKPFDPDWTIPPGCTLRLTLTELEMDTAQLQERSGIPVPWLLRFFRGDAELTAIEALGLETATGIKAPIWMRMERRYREDVAAGKTVAREPSTELVVWHDWPNCFKEHCIECVWWDICWILAEHGIYTRVPWG